MVNPIKSSDNIWVIKQTNASDSKAYMTLEIGDIEKKKATGASWASRKVTDGVTYKNAPISGFTIVGFSTRYRTDNKWVRVQDPRGFVIEISVENFIDLLQVVDTSKGVIVDKLFYGRTGNSQSAQLFHESEYASAFAPTTSMNVKELSRFDVYCLMSNPAETYMNLGKVKVDFEIDTYLIPYNTVVSESPDGKSTTQPGWVVYDMTKHCNKDTKVLDTMTTKRTFNMSMAVGFQDECPGQLRSSTSSPVSKLEYTPASFGMPESGIDANGIKEKIIEFVSDQQFVNKRNHEAVEKVNDNNRRRHDNVWSNVFVDLSHNRPVRVEMSFDADFLDPEIAAVRKLTSECLETKVNAHPGLAPAMKWHVARHTYVLVTTVKVNSIEYKD